MSPYPGMTQHTTVQHHDKRRLSPTTASREPRNRVLSNACHRLASTSLRIDFPLSPKAFVKCCPRLHHQICRTFHSFVVTTFHHQIRGISAKDSSTAVSHQLPKRLVGTDSWLVQEVQNVHGIGKLHTIFTGMVVLWLDCRRLRWCRVDSFEKHFLLFSVFVWEKFVRERSKKKQP